jgi:gamma-glutamylcyclotransferase (GGCT)/AIG2-like uncharacterized protein YtfP
MNKLYAVYGTLKKGFGNHRLIEQCSLKFEGFVNLDCLEGYPRFYDKTEIDTPVGTAHVYFLTEEYADNELVESGNWTRQW